MDKQNVEEKAERLPEIGPRLRSRRIFPGNKRSTFPIGLLMAKKLDKQAEDVQNLILALIEAEKEIFELRHRFENQRKTLIRQALHEIGIRKESLKINNQPQQTIDELTMIYKFIQNLKL